MRKYLNLSIAPLLPDLKRKEEKPGAKFIFAMFPHGCGSEHRILMEGIFQHSFPNIYKNVRVLTASVLFYIPLVREVAIWTGCVDANRKTAKYNLEKGNSLVVLPGGEQEQLLTEYGKEVLYLEKRKGFIKLAIRHCVPVVPVYAFGVSDMYHTSNRLMRLRRWLVKKLGICIPLPRGLFGSFFCPLPKKVTIVFGNPKMYAMNGLEPTNEEIDSAHDDFIKNLRLLFDSHKTSYGYGDRNLIIV